MTAVGTPAAAPFVGLRPFDTADAAWFFGRDRETASLTRKLRASRFTAVVGPSGSGKSSVVRAGVVPLLQKDGWHRIVTTPGSAPLDRLARALAGAEPDDPLEEARRFRFDAMLRASAFGLAEIAETLVADAPQVLLVVDQFEELFRYGDEARGAKRAAMREEARALVELLLAATRSTTGRLRVCITMRSDYFGACSAYVGLAEAVSASQFLIPLPQRGQLEDAIRKPVAKAGAVIEEGLVQRLLVDVEEEQDQLPLLQHTLRRLWDQATGEPRTIREEDYVAVGRIAGSIDKKAEAIVAALSKAHPSDIATLECVMKALTDLGERNRATRRPQKRSELLALVSERLATADAAAAAESLDRVLAALGAEDTSFLMVGDGDDPGVDIGHEALIRSWMRLSGQRRDFASGWLREERDDGERWRNYVRRAAEGAILGSRELGTLSIWLSRTLGNGPEQRHDGERWRDYVRRAAEGAIPRSRELGALSNWLSRRALGNVPEAVWPKRYGGNYIPVVEFVDNSFRAEKKARLYRYSFVAAVLVALLVTVGFGARQWDTAKVYSAKAEKLYQIALNATDDLTDAIGDQFNPYQIVILTSAIMKGKDAFAKLAANNPDDVQLLGIQARSLYKFAVAYRETGGYEQLALTTATEADKLFRKLAKNDRDNTDWRRYLSLNLNMMGDLRSGLPADASDYAGARSNFEEALQIDSELAQREPQNEEHLRQMGIDLGRIGDLQLIDKDTVGALESYEKASDVRQKLAELYPVLPIYRQDASSILEKIGNLKLKSNDNVGALKAYQEKLTIDKHDKFTLSFEEPDYDKISVDLLNIASLQDQLGHDVDARMSYEKSLASDNKLVAKDIIYTYNHRQITRLLRIAMTYRAIGDLQLRSGDVPGAEESYKKAFAGSIKAVENAIGARKAARSQNEDDTFNNDYTSAMEQRLLNAVLSDQRQDALKIAESEILKSNPEGPVAINRAHAYLLNGRFDEARDIYQTWIDKPMNSDNAKTYADDIRDIFDKFRKLGIASPDADRMSKGLKL